MSARIAGASFVRIGLAVLALLLGGPYAVCEDRNDQSEPTNQVDAELRETSRLIQAELPRWRIAIGPDNTQLKLEPNPILRWTNPATGRIYGDIFIWTAGGRPEAVTSLYKAWQPAWGFTGEFLSLSEKNLVARRNQAVIWKCDQAGIALQDLFEAPAPAENARQRLRQMRAMATGFSVVLVDRRRNVDGERQALRQLSKPVYRYQLVSGEAIDGAIFAFVLGTDPETLLLLEARGQPDDARWTYAFARLNRDELAGYYKQREVWQVDRLADVKYDEPYFLKSLPDSARRK
ncbi:MAG TPA: hypothetical protein VHC19_08630 [Pirellulales bacterium]|nr:hypothetical protein [Pirellulales bacterium]